MFYPFVSTSCMATWDANAFCAKSLGCKHVAQKFVSAYTARKHRNCKTEVLHLDGTKMPKFSVSFPQNGVNTQMKRRRNGIFRSVQQRQNVNFLMTHTVHLHERL